jgi:tetratricopeptide (TPR) repeat protein
MASSKFDLSSFRQFIHCDRCDKPNPQKRCSQCRCTYYCSVKCQKEDWTTSAVRKQCHKVLCNHRHNESLKATNSKNIVAEAMEPVRGLNDSCAICLEEPIVNPVVLKGCRHAFCSICLMDWQQHQQRELMLAPSDPRICPVCRQTLPQPTVKEVLEKARAFFAAGDLEDVSYNEANDPIIVKISGDTLVPCAGSALPKTFPRYKNERQRRLYQMAIDQLDQVLHHDPYYITALEIRGEFLRYVNPDEAIKAIEMALDIDQEGYENDKKMEALQEQINNSTGEERSRNWAAMISLMKAKDFHISQLGSGPYRSFSAKIWMAEAYETLGNYTKAYSIFHPMLKTLFSLKNPELSEIDLYTMIAVIAGMARCCYVGKNYALAINSCEMVLRRDRHIPGNHLVLAQSQWALGEKEAALTTLKRGLLYEYEMPHCAQNRQRNLVCLERLSSLYAKTSLTMGGRQFTVSKSVDGMQ